MAKKKKKLQQGGVLPIEWEHNPKAQYHFLDDKFNKEIAKRKAGSHSMISRQDYDKFKQGTLPGNHPLMNLLGGHRKRVISEFENSPELSHLRAGEINLSLIPKMITNGKEHDGSLGSGSGFDILSRAYNRTPKPLIEGNNDYLEPVEISTPVKKKLGPGEYPAFQRKKNMKAQEIPYGNVLGKAYGLQQGGIIEDNRGQLAHPGKITKINSPRITMKGVKNSLLGISDTGDTKIMHPEQDYMFNGNSVTEFPLKKSKKKGQQGITTPQNYNQFNVDPIQTNWGSENLYAPGQFTQQGQFNQFNSAFPQQPQGNFFNKIGGMQGIIQGAGRIGGAIAVDQNSQEGGPSAAQSAIGSFGPWGAAISAVSQGLTNATKDSKTLAGQTLNSYADPFATFSDKNLSKTDRIIGGFVPLYGGIKKWQAKKDRDKQENKLKKLVDKAAGLQDPDANNRKYFRPEDQLLDPNSLANSYGTGSNFLKNGGNLQMGGELQTYNGEAEPVSQNPYLPGNGQSVLFRGASHDNGGIDIKFGKTPVEVEGGEPAVKLENGLTVFGDMNIPAYGALELNDPKAKGKKFKTYVNDLNKKESKQNDITDESMLAINSNPLATSFDKLRMSSNEAMLKGANMNLQDIAQKKQIASNVQKAILDTAEEFNLDSSELAKGNFKKMKKSKKTAQQGDIIPTSIGREEVQKWIDLGFAYDPQNPNRLLRTTNIPGKTEYKDIYQGKGGDEYNKWFKANYNKNTKGKTLDSKWGPMLMELGKRTNKITYPGSSNTDYIDIFDPTGKLTQIDSIDPRQIPSPYQTPQAVPQQQGQRGNFDWMGLINTALPFLRPSNQKPLDPNQLSGEYYALASNQLEGVQAQKYNPLLEQYSDISLQDQLNENTADFRSIQRSVSNNPSALAALAAQKYQANSGVLGEQFRLNQTQRQDTYNRNRGTLNDAQLKNLGILDQQYVRQSEAKSKTKAVAQSAIESIANKIAQNNLENRTLGVYENLYNYRFGERGHAFNMNPLFTPNIPQVGADLPLYNDGDNTLTVEEYRQKYDRIGNPSGSERRSRTTKKNENGGIVKALKGY